MLHDDTFCARDVDHYIRLRQAGVEKPIYLTRNGEGEMVFLPIDLWEKRQAELELFAEMLRREQNQMAGAKTYSAADMRVEAEELLREG